MTSPLLEIDDLTIHFPVRETGMLRKRHDSVVQAVDGVSLSVGEGEIVGLVGESGCGKTTLCRAIMGFVRPLTGAIRFRGEPMPGGTKMLRQWRRHVQMVFQDPYASLNPRMTVFDTLAEAVQQRRALSGEALRSRVSALMDSVGLAARFMRKYPHEFSGGQRQRIAIARALAPEPDLLIADEPVSALDVSIRSQIINLLNGLVADLGLGMIFISHDLSVVHHLADRVAVMYLGRVVETGPARKVIQHPVHPYTRALVSAIPEPDPERERLRQRIVLNGEPPSSMNPPGGCRFHTRCRYATAACGETIPEDISVAEGWHAACLRISEIQREPKAAVPEESAELH